MIRTYSDLSRLTTYESRFEYLKLKGQVGQSTFGFDRYLNQAFYSSKQWKDARNFVIVRDNGCDMGFEENPIGGRIIIHHMNPITEEDLDSRNSDIYNPEFLICVSEMTHNAIHFGDESLLPKGLIIRKKGDTKLW